MQEYRRMARGRQGDYFTFALGLCNQGGMGYETPPTWEQALKNNIRAQELGFCFVDGAPLYGNGLSLANQGDVLRSQSPPEVSRCVFTKGGRKIVEIVESMGRRKRVERFYTTPPEYAPLMSKFDYSPEGIRESLYQSRMLLGLETVEAMALHDPNESRVGPKGLGQSVRELIKLREEGLIRRAGIAIKLAGVETLMGLLKDYGHKLDYVILSGFITLLDQSQIHRVLNLCKDRELAVYVCSLLGGNILSFPAETFDHRLEKEVMYLYRKPPQAIVEKVRLLHKFAAKHEVDPIAAAYQVALFLRGINGMILGATKPEQLTMSVDALLQRIPIEFWRDLQQANLLAPDIEIWEGPLLVKV